MSQPITLKELAELLNLAPSTVSKALKGHSDISEATQARVKALASKMCYQPNALAKYLRNRKSYAIALILPDLGNYFYIQALQAIIEWAGSRNYRVIVYESQEQYRKEADICHALLKSGVDGLLISPSKTTRDTGHLKMLQDAGLPLVFLNRVTGNLETDRILSDDYSGACLAVNHLIDTGCQKLIHFSASQKWLWAQKRQLGFLQALQEHHLPLNRNLIMEYCPTKEFLKLLHKKIEQYHINGIFTITDDIAIEVMLTLQKSGYRFPEDISICGFGNIPAGRVTSPPLTTVSNNGREAGKEATELLINRIENKIQGNYQTVLLKNELIIRESTY